MRTLPVYVTECVMCQCSVQLLATPVTQSKLWALHACCVVWHSRCLSLFISPWALIYRCQLLLILMFVIKYQQYSGNFAWKNFPLLYYRYWFILSEWIRMSCGPRATIVDQKAELDKHEQVWHIFWDIEIL